MTEENIESKIGFLIKELQEMTGVSDSEIDEFRKIIDHADFSLDKDWILKNGISECSIGCKFWPY